MQQFEMPSSPIAAAARPPGRPPDKSLSPEVARAAVSGNDTPRNSAAVIAIFKKASALQEACSSVAAGTAPGASPSAGGSGAPILLPPADVLRAEQSVAFADAGRGGAAKTQAGKKASAAVVSAVASAAVDGTAAGHSRAESFAAPGDPSAPSARPLYASARSQAVGRISPGVDSDPLREGSTASGNADPSGSRRGLQSSSRAPRQLTLDRVAFETPSSPIHFDIREFFGAGRRRIQDRNRRRASAQRASAMSWARTHYERTHCSAVCAMAPAPTTNAVDEHPLSSVSRAGITAVSPPPSGTQLVPTNVTLSPRCHLPQPSPAPRGSPPAPAPTSNTVDEHPPSSAPLASGAGITAVSPPPSGTQLVPADVALCASTNEQPRSTIRDTQPKASRPPGHPPETRSRSSSSAALAGQLSPAALTAATFDDPTTMSSCNSPAYASTAAAWDVVITPPEAARPPGRPPEACARPSSPALAAEHSPQPSAAPRGSPPAPNEQPRSTVRDTPPEVARPPGRPPEACARPSSPALAAEHLPQPFAAPHGTPPQEARPPGRPPGPRERSAGSAATAEHHPSMRFDVQPSNAHCSPLEPASTTDGGLRASVVAGALTGAAASWHSRCRQGHGVVWRG